MKLNSVFICGWGSISKRFVTRAKDRYPDLKFKIISRNPKRGADFDAANVSFHDYSALAESEDPIIFCLSSHETDIIKLEQSKGSKDIPRHVVLEPNLKILKSIFIAEHWKHKPIFILTNPVEPLCDFIYEQTGNFRIYGIGMATDQQRVLEVLESNFAVESKECVGLMVTGFHGTRSIPLISRHPELMTKLRKTCSHNDHEIYQKIFSKVDAMIRTEFRGPNPPVYRAVASLMVLLDALVRQTSATVSGKAGEYFLGGRLNLDTYTFEAPTGHSAVEREILDREIEYYRSHLR